MKRLVAALTVVMIFVVFLTGCKNIKDSITEDTGEAITEEEAFIDDSEYMTIGAEAISWPQATMGNLPVPKATITGIVDAGETGCTVVISEMSRADAEQYLQSIQDLGYTEDALNMTDDDGVWYMGNTQDGAMVTFSYTNIFADGMISYVTASSE